MTAKSILATTAVLATLGQGPYVPARLDSGAPPPPRVHVITWGHDYPESAMTCSAIPFDRRYALPEVASAPSELTNTM